MKYSILLVLLCVLSIKPCFSQLDDKCKKLFQEKSEEWKRDSLGCLHLRYDILRTTIMTCKIKKKTYANDFISILGKPSKKVEFKDKDYYGILYILSDDPNYSSDQFFLALYFNNKNRYKSMRIIPPE